MQATKIYWVGRGWLAYRLKKTVVLVGMMGAGKTAVGSALASQIGVEFRDSDAEIMLAANMKIGEIFDRDGEDFFRERETEVLRRLLDGQACILSTGGGAFLSERNRAIVAQRATSVWLKADLDLLWSRVRHKNTRPLLQTDNPRETLRQLIGVREKSYRLADLVVTGRHDYSIADMAAQVVVALLACKDTLERL